MTESWYCSSCPKCKRDNWVCAGDPNDMSGYDPEGIRCWDCGYCWNLSDDMDYNDEMSNDEDPRYDLGKHFEEVKHDR